MLNYQRVYNLAIHWYTSFCDRPKWVNLADSAQVLALMPELWALRATVGKALSTIRTVNGYHLPTSILDGFWSGFKDGFCITKPATMVIRAKKHVIPSTPMGELPAPLAQPLTPLALQESRRVCVLKWPLGQKNHRPNRRSNMRQSPKMISFSQF